MLNPDPHVMVLGGGTFWEVVRSLGWSPQDGISALRKEIQRALSPFHHVKQLQKDAVYEPESDPSPDTESAGDLMLDFQPAC